MIPNRKNDLPCWCLLIPHNTLLVLKWEYSHFVPLPQWGYIYLAAMYTRISLTVSLLQSMFQMAGWECETFSILGSRGCHCKHLWVMSMLLNSRPGKLHAIIVYSNQESGSPGDSLWAGIVGITFCSRAVSHYRRNRSLMMLDTQIHLWQCELY